MRTAQALAAEIAALPKRDTPSVRAVRRRWSDALKPAPATDVIALATAHERDAGQTGKWVAYELIRFHKGAFSAIDPGLIQDFARRAASWYAVDALGTILTGPLWARGSLGDGLIGSWSMSPDLWLRRSALVATVGAKADAARTLAICRRLVTDREDMVEKGLSWALRELSKRDRPAVETFMAQMGEALPARVRREVGHKLRTGLKTPRRR